MDQKKRNNYAVKRIPNHQVANRYNQLGTYIKPITYNFFQGNLAPGMKFGGEDHDLSGYVKRTITMKDRYGNMQVAKEEQFFNSSKKPMKINIKDKRHKDNDH